MKRELSLFLMFLVVLACLPGCTEREEADGPEACRDYIHALAEKAEECGGSYERTYEEIENALSPEEGCEVIFGVKHDDEFFDSCLPGIGALTCTEFQTAELPGSCEGQLVRF